MSKDEQTHISEIYERMNMPVKMTTKGETFHNRKVIYTTEQNLLTPQLEQLFKERVKEVKRINREMERSKYNSLYGIKPDAQMTEEKDEAPQSNTKKQIDSDYSEKEENKDTKMNNQEENIDDLF